MARIKGCQTEMSFRASKAQSNESAQRFSINMATNRPKFSEEQQRNIEGRREILQQILGDSRPPKHPQHSVTSIYINLFKIPRLAYPQSILEIIFNRLTQAYNYYFQTQIQRIEGVLGERYFDRTTCLWSMLYDFKEKCEHNHGERVIKGSSFNRKVRKLDFTVDSYYEECLGAEMEKRVTSHFSGPYHSIGETYRIDGDRLIVRLNDDVVSFYEVRLEDFIRWPVDKNITPYPKIQGAGTDPDVLEKLQEVAYARENGLSTRTERWNDWHDRILDWVYLTNLHPLEDAWVAQGEDEKPNSSGKEFVTTMKY